MVIVTRSERFDGWEVFEYIETSDDEDEQYLDFQDSLPFSRRRELFLSTTDTMRHLKPRKDSTGSKLGKDSSKIALNEKEMVATTQPSARVEQYVESEPRSTIPSEPVGLPSSAPTVKSCKNGTQSIVNDSDRYPLHKPSSDAPTATANKTPSQSGSKFLSLPPDIILILSQHLPIVTLLSLRSTCHAMYTILDPPHVSRLRQRFITQSLAIERARLATYRSIHPRYGGRDTLWDLFSMAFEWQLLERPVGDLRCYGCLEMKPLRCFVERMSSRGMGLGGRGARGRRCKGCMLRVPPSGEEDGKGMKIAGVWWREHWLRRADTVRRRGVVERYVGKMVRGTSPRKVERGEEVGVCAECGTGQFELYWGCRECFEVEQVRRRKEEWEMMTGIDDADDLEPWFRWVLEKRENLRGKREKKKRERYARRAECGGKWWNIRRYAGWMGIDVRWRGSWAERVESLVDHLEESYQRRAAQLAVLSNTNLADDSDSDEEDSGGEIDGVDIRDNRSRRSSTTKGKSRHSSTKHDKKPPTPTNPTQKIREWKPTDPIGSQPLPSPHVQSSGSPSAVAAAATATNESNNSERFETRCAICWTPSCRRGQYMAGLAHGAVGARKLPLERCCATCREEDGRKVRGKRAGKGGGAADGGLDDIGLGGLFEVGGVGAVV